MYDVAPLLDYIQQKKKVTNIPHITRKITTIHKFLNQFNRNVTCKMLEVHLSLSCRKQRSILGQNNRCKRNL